MVQKPLVVFPGFTLERLRRVRYFNIPLLKYTIWKLSLYTEDLGLFLFSLLQICYHSWPTFIMRPFSLMNLELINRSAILSCRTVLASR